MDTACRGTTWRKTGAPVFCAARAVAKARGHGRKTTSTTMRMIAVVILDFVRYSHSYHCRYCHSSYSHSYVLLLELLKVLSLLVLTSITNVVLVVIIITTFINIPYNVNIIITVDFIGY